MEDPYNKEAILATKMIDQTEATVQKAKSLYERKKYDAAFDKLTDAIQTCPWSPDLYELRVNINIADGFKKSAILDLQSILQLETYNTEGYFRVSILFYQLGQVFFALQSVRECLKFDPEHTRCFSFYKKIKNVNKLLEGAMNALKEEQYELCVNKAKNVIKEERQVEDVRHEANVLLCSCYSKDQKSSEAIKFCTKAINYQHNPAQYCDRADAYLQAGVYSSAFKDYNFALNLDGGNLRARDGLWVLSKHVNLENLEYMKQEL